MSITVTFNPPLPSDSPAVFNSKAFNTLGDLNTWSTEANALAVTVNGNASTASTGASTATTKASEASASASAASTSAGTATTQAGIATTKAGEAAASATAAATSAADAAATLASKVTGPSSATDNALVRFDGTTGKLVQNSGVTVDDSGNLTAGGGTFTNTVRFAAGAFIGADTDVYAYESASGTLTFRTGTVGAEKYFSFNADGSFSIISGGATLNGPVDITNQAAVNGVSPSFLLNDTNGPTDKKYWRWILDNGYYHLENVNDAFNAVVMTPLIIDSSGNVGIGRTPDARFEAYQASTANITVAKTVSDANPTGISWTYHAIEKSGGYGGAIGGYIHQGVGSGLGLFTTNGGVMTERLRIDGSGNATFNGNVKANGRYLLTNATHGTDNNALTVSFQGGDVTTGAFAANGAAIALRGSASGYNNNGVEFYAGGAERLRIDSSGNATFRNSTGFGYGTGSGGTVTQATSKSTAVTLNKPSGQIAMHNAALADSTTVVMPFNNSTIGDTDIVVFTCDGGFGANYLVWGINPTAGAISVAVRNVSGVSQSQALVINFAVIKGSTT